MNDFMAAAPAEDVTYQTVRAFHNKGFERSPHGMERGTQCRLYSSAHTSQTEPGLSVSMVSPKPSPDLIVRRLMRRSIAWRGGEIVHYMLFIRYAAFESNYKNIVHQCGPQRRQAQPIRPSRARRTSQTTYLMTGGLGNDVKGSGTQGIETTKTSSFKLKPPGVWTDDDSSTEHIV